MKYVIGKHTSVYRGDHSAEVVIFLDPIKDETVEELLTRAEIPPVDYITLHVMHDSSPAPSEVKEGKP